MEGNVRIYRVTPHIGAAGHAQRVGVYSLCGGRKCVSRKRFSPGASLHEMAWPEHGTKTVFTVGRLYLDA